LFHYPAHMTFFTTSELLEIGAIPFPSPNAKPTRNEALEYYRKVAEHYRLDARLYQTVEKVTGADGNYRVQIRDRFGREGLLRAKKLIIATGYYDLPNYLGIPGEDLSKVMHYYDDPHPFAGLDVLVIGGKNSAAIAALELWRHGARVTLVHRGPAIHRHVKYWIKPDIENRIKNGEIAAHFETRIAAIGLDSVDLETPSGPLRLKNDFVFALTGYHPDYEFLEKLGVQSQGVDRTPICDTDCLESNIAGIYLAGVIIAGARTNEIFIENGRFHGRQIAADLVKKRIGGTL
ncbi:MAG TPA: YpdA family putative bacillithiol disulfide reductase, partial [Acidobacteriaceae bacterium]|nr:YpdA family putative bacillithiol disulfide reductase [Acidobacteriaceae bacterium]